MNGELVRPVGDSFIVRLGPSGSTKRKVTACGSAGAGVPSVYHSKIDLKGLASEHGVDVEALEAELDRVFEAPVDAGDADLAPPQSDIEVKATKRAKTLKLEWRPAVETTGPRTISIELKQDSATKQKDFFLDTFKTLLDGKTALEADIGRLNELDALKQGQRDEALADLQSFVEDTQKDEERRLMLFDRLLKNKQNHKLESESQGTGTSGSSQEK